MADLTPEEMAFVEATRKRRNFSTLGMPEPMIGSQGISSQQLNPSVPTKEQAFLTAVNRLKQSVPIQEQTIDPANETGSPHEPILNDMEVQQPQPAGGETSLQPAYNQGLQSGALSEVKKGFEMQAQAADMAYQQGQKDFQYLKGVRDQQIGMAQEEAAKHQAVEKELQVLGDKYMKALDEAQFRMENTAPSKSFSDWFGEKSTAGKIMWGIALGAATAASMTKAGSAPLALITRAIDSDIDAQEKRYAATKDYAQNLNQAYGHFVSAVGNTLVARAATTNSMYKWADAQIDRAIEQTKNEQQKSNLLKIKGELRQKWGEKQIELQETIANGAASRFANRVRAMSELSSLNGAGDERKLIVPGVGVAQDEASAKNARAAKESLDKTLSKIDRVIELRNRYGSEEFGPHKDEMNLLGSQLRLALKDAQKLGALSGGDYEELYSQVFKNTGGKWGFVVPQLQSLRRQVIEDANSTFRASGINNPLYSSGEPAGLKQVGTTSK